MKPQRFDWDAVDPSSLVVAPSVYPQARETSALAAVATAPDRATQSYTILRLVTAAGDTGMTDEEIQDATGYSRATICARRGFDLRAHLMPATRRGKSRSGRPMTAWRRRTADEMEAGCVRRRAGDWPGTMVTPGLPDVLAFIPVRGVPATRTLVAWEVKAPGGRLRPEQIEFQTRCFEAGLAHVAGDLTALMHWLVAAKFLRADQLPASRQPKTRAPIPAAPGDPDAE